MHEQKAACQSHRVIPILLKNWAEPIDASAQDNWVKYRLNDGGFEFVNGQPPEGYTSAELHALEHKPMMADAFVMDMRANFGGRIAA